MIQSVPVLKQLVVSTSMAVLLAACASSPSTPEGAVAARERLMRLQANPELASRAAIEIRDADAAVSAAELRRDDDDLTRHLVLMADHKIEIASAWAQSRLYVDQRSALAREAEQARLDARTLEAERARSDATRAQGQASVARSDAARAQDQAAVARQDAAAARVDTGVAREQTAAAQRETEELQRMIVALNARETDRGIVVTLGDVLFATGQSTLRGGTTANLDTLAAFLGRYDERQVLVEGHTDSVGSDAENLALSQRRADAVRTYLLSRQVDSGRVNAVGKGEAFPIADNGSATGRQQNRRVEVIISGNQVLLP